MKAPSSGTTMVRSWGLLAAVTLALGVLNYCLGDVQAGCLLTLLAVTWAIIPAAHLSWTRSARMQARTEMFASLREAQYRGMTVEQWMQSEMERALAEFGERR